MVEITDGAGRTISPPLNSEDVEVWLENFESEKKADFNARNTVKNRLLLILRWLLFTPFIFFCLVICIPYWLFTGKSVLEWVDVYHESLHKL